MDVNAKGVEIDHLKLGSLFDGSGGFPLAGIMKNVPNLAKSISGLEHCVNFISDPNNDEPFLHCTDCPYRTNSKTCDNPAVVMAEALEVLQSYQPRLLRIYEIHRGMAVWIERINRDECVLAIGGSEAGYAKCFITALDESVAFNNADYNVTWRAWTSEPTKEQMDSEEWNKKGV